MVARCGMAWEPDCGRQKTDLAAPAWAREVERLGAGVIVLYSTDADGTQTGCELYPTRLLASMIHFGTYATQQLKNIGMDGTVAGAHHRMPT